MPVVTKRSRKIFSDKSAYYNINLYHYNNLTRYDNNLITTNPIINVNCHRLIAKKSQINAKPENTDKNKKSH